MADEAAKRKAASDWIKKPYAAYQAYAAKQKKLFEALNAFVTERGGWIISPPGDKRVRIECCENSEIPIRLAELGHSLRYCSKATRNTSSGIVPTDIIELKLPGR